MDSVARYALDKFNNAIKAYRYQDWDAAEHSLRELTETDDKLLYNIYLDRIRQFRQEPPVGDWDGVYDHVTK